MSVDSEVLRQRLARKGTWRRHQSKQVISKPAGRVSTFPVRFEALRDRLKAQHPDLSVASIENMIYTIVHGYPIWYGMTPDADAKAHALKRDHDVTHGFIKAAPLTANQQAALIRRKQERQDREHRIAARASEALVQEAS